MALNTAEIQSKRGGKRLGAGRPKRDLAVWMEARGVHPATAAEILSNANERALWHRLLTSPDDRVCLESVKFLTVMRDGKPAQRIHVTSTNVTVSVDEIQTARRVIAEILAVPLLTNESTEVNQVVNSEEKANAALEARDAAAPSIMLQGDQGGKKDGIG